MNYGFKNEAKHIAKKYLDLCNDLLKKTGKLWEKNDVVKKDIGVSERYPTQSGFGWTNAVIVRLIDRLGE
jgi:alpha,alpha-trehalase